MRQSLLVLFIFSLFACKNAEPKMINNPDWPNLNRYAAANKTLLQQPKDTNRIVFMGNSITEGWSQDSLDFFDNLSFINRGIGGQTTPQMLTRFRADVINLEPKAVVILAGINDIAHNTGPMTIDQTMANIESMAQLAEANGIMVYLCSVLPAANFPWRPDIDPTNKVVNLNRMIKEFADENRFVYVDYFSPMATQENGMIKEFTYDEIHCTVAGYKKMESIINPLID